MNVSMQCLALLLHKILIYIFGVGLFKDDISMSEVNDVEKFAKNIMNEARTGTVVDYFKALA
jgi:hypothetical protein